VRQACPVCSGTGQMIKNPCSTCQGSGRVKTRRRLTLKIPKGVETGSRLRLPGKGEGGARGGPPGDLYVVMHVREHAVFKRREDDLFVDVPVPFHTLVLGGEVQVPTIDGNAKLKVAPGTESGKVFRLRNKGMPSVDGYGRGSLHVQISADFPSRLNSKQKAALKQFRDLMQDADFAGHATFHKQVDAFFEKKASMAD